MLLFRVDASPEIGFGHLYRSACLASILKHRMDVRFTIRGDKSVKRFLQQKNIPFTAIEDINEDDRRLIRGIIFDLRSFSTADQNLLNWAKEFGLPTIQFSDRSDSLVQADLHIDASLEPFHTYEKDYLLLSGQSYSVIHQKFRHFHRVKRRYRKKTKYILISFGSHKDYRKLRQMIDLCHRFDFRIKVASGFYMNESLKKILRRLYPRIHFVGKTESLARSFFECDVAVITAGNLAYEAAACGTPVIYYFRNKFQQRGAGAFEKAGAGLVAESFEKIGNKQLICHLQNLTFEKRVEMGEAGKKLVDAKGAYRIIEWLEEKNFIKNLK